MADTRAKGCRVVSNFLYQVSIWALPVLLAITLHEAAHAYVAWVLGDDTARRLGRVSLNPLRHVHPVGTVLLPLLCVVMSLGVVFGFAKPVPVNFARLGNRRRDTILVAVAGPAANIILLLASTSLLIVVAALPPPANDWAREMLIRSMFLNALLAVFNMLPIPPLDGGRILIELLPTRLGIELRRLERYGILLVLGLFVLVPVAAGLLGMNDELVHNFLLTPVIALVDLSAALVGPF